MGGSKSVIAKLGNVMRRNQTAQSMFWGKTNKQTKKKRHKFWLPPRLLGNNFLKFKFDYLNPWLYEGCRPQNLCYSRQNYRHRRAGLIHKHCSWQIIPTHRILSHNIFPLLLIDSLKRHDAASHRDSCGGSCRGIFLNFGRSRFDCFPPLPV